MSAADRARRQTSWVGKAREVPWLDPLGLCGDDLSVYWELPAGGEAFAGFGLAGALLSERSAEALGQAEAARVRWLGAAPDAPGPWWGGVAFDPSREGEARWAGFGGARWILPAAAVTVRGGRALALAFGDAGPSPDVEAELDRRLEALVTRAAGARPPPLSDTGTSRGASSEEGPSARWSGLVGAALSSIEEGTLSKVVVARAVDVALERPLSRVGVLASLRERHPGCAIFLFAGPSGADFLGATPETLLRADGGVLYTEALAGTLPPGATLADAGDKERREHHAVVEAVRAALAPCSAALQVDEAPSLVRLARLSHLRTGVRAELRAGSSLAGLALALHPTPAVAGAPRGEALRFLRAREGFDRGWYAGFVGWMGEGAAHLRVALRCALVEGARARLYAGAGIVAGSEAQGEWAETVVKASAMREALGGPHVQP